MLGPRPDLKHDTRLSRLAEIGLWKLRWGAGVVSNGRSKLNRHLTRIVLGASVAYFVCIDAMTPPGESVYAPVFGPVAMRVPWR